MKITIRKNTESDRDMLKLEPECSNDMFYFGQLFELLDHSQIIIDYVNNDIKIIWIDLKYVLEKLINRNEHQYFIPMNINAKR